MTRLLPPLLSLLMAAAALAFGYIILIAWPALAPPPLARFGYLLAPLAPALLLALLLRPFIKDRAFTWAAPAALASIAALIAWTLWREVARLGPYVDAGYSLRSVAGSLDAYALAGAALAGLFFALLAKLRYATKRTRRGSRASPRARTALHGDADWIPIDDATQLLPQAPGIVIGEAYRPDLDRRAGPRFDPRDKTTWGKGGKSPLLCFSGQFGSGHGLIFAGSGGFKTTGTVVPTCLNWPGPLVVVDPSIEVLPIVKAARARRGRSVIGLSPETPSLGFNVLDWIHDAGAPEENIATVIGWIMSDPGRPTSGNEDFFRTSAAQLLIGLLADLLLSGKTPAEHQTLAQLREVLAQPEPKLKSRLRDIYEASPARFVRDTIGPFVSMTDATFSGVYAQAAKETQWLAYDRYAQLVSANKFRSQALRDGQVDVFINVDLKTLENNPALGRVILGALLNSVYDGHGRSGQQVLFLIDEAARLGPMKLLETARDTGRKYGLNLLLIYQSIGQLIDTWGHEARSKWFESTSFAAFASVRDIKMAEELSKICGSYTAAIEQRSRSTGSHNRLASSTSMTSNRSRSTQLHKANLINPDEILAGMRADEQIVLMPNQPPLRCGRAIYFRRADMLAATHR